jgi:hypothetical protein
METKVAKTNLKTTQKMKSIRISLENQKKAEKFLALANKKKIGRTVKFDQALSIALDLLTEDHAKKLQDQSLSNEDRKEILRQKWAELYGPISKDAFTGVMLTKDFSEFLKVTESAESVAQLSA